MKLAAIYFDECKAVRPVVHHGIFRVEIAETSGAPRCDDGLRDRLFRVVARLVEMAAERICLASEK